MLVLSRRADQKVIFPNLGISVEVINVKGKSVRLGIDAPRSIKILRGELSAEHEVEDSKTVFDQLAKRVDALDMAERHEVKNYLNTASLSVHVAQKMLERDNLDEVDRNLGQAFDALKTLNELLGATQPQRELASPAVKVDSPYSRDKSKSTSWTALVVEDNDNERELLAGVLRMSGFEVVAVENGLAAIEHLKNNSQPDVVLMDMHMPQMDGPETVNKIRSELQQDSLPIFAVTGMTQTESKLPIGDRGVTGWFSKPVDPNQLVQHLVCKIESSLN